MCIVKVTFNYEVKVQKDSVLDIYLSYSPIDPRPQETLIMRKKNINVSYHNIQVSQQKKNICDDELHSSQSC